MLMAAGVVVRIKGSRDLMHFKSYVIDGTLLRTGAANWSPTGLKRQDNDVHYEVYPILAAQFEASLNRCGIEPRMSHRYRLRYSDPKNGAARLAAHRK
jgi:phosphatidylserine/phosphatidylglycerophosphate/cardiolipin synthase-like enzyme